MTERLRGWLLPPLAVSFALGVLLGRAAASPWYGAVGCLAGLAACLLLRDRGRFCALLALFLALGCLRGFFGYHPVLPPEGEVSVTGVVSEEIQTRDNGQVRSALADLRLDGLPLSGGAYWSFYADTLPEGLGPGMSVSFRGRVYHPSRALNPDGYDFREELLRRSIRVGIYGNDDLTVSPPDFFSFAGFTARLRHRLSAALTAALGDEAGPYAAAMLLGARSNLPREDRTAFSRLGIAHLLSVSGFHVGLLIGLLALLFRLLRLPQPLRMGLYASVLTFYCALCGWSQPVLRASLLLLLSRAGRMLNRPRSPLHLLSAAWLILLWMNPVQLTGLSFQLTFGAVLGLALVTPTLSSFFHPENRIARWLRDGLAAGVGAQIGILLPELYAFQELPLLGLMVNIPALALGAGLLGLYWAALLTLPLPWLNGPVCAVARWATAAFLACVRALGSLPGVTLWTRTSGTLTVIGMLLLTAGLCCLFRWKRRSRALMTGFGLALTVLSLLPWPHRSAEYVQLAVGGADASVLWDQDQVIVMDAGYEDGALSDFLHRRRLTPDAVILTHLHTDHVLGLEAMMEDGIPIRRIYLPWGAERADIHPSALELLDRLRAGGTDILTLAAGDRLPLPDGEIRVLWPEEGMVRPGQDANESCLTVMIDIRGTALLQTGDLDGRYEMYAAAPADLLKVAHHGSFSSTSEAFLAAVDPSAALLSCDRTERHRQVAERLGAVPLYSTAAHGMLTVRFGDHAFTVETFLTPEATEIRTQKEVSSDDPDGV